MNWLSIFTALAAPLLFTAALAAQPEFNFEFETSPEFWADEALDDAWLLANEDDAGAKLLALGKRSFLGVNVSEIDAERAKALKLKEERGVEITRVEEGSPADKAGLKKGDVVLDYNGQRVEGTEQFVRMVRETPPGRQVKLLVSREGSPQTLTATIGSTKGRPIHVIAPKVDFDRLKKDLEELKEFRVPEMPRAYMSWRSTMLGIEAESIDDQLAEYFGVKQGVLVRSVLKDTPAEKAGLKAGDVILKVDDEKVTTPREVSRAVRAARAKKTFPITVSRKGKEMTLTVTVDSEDRSWTDPPTVERVIRKTELRY